MELAPVICNNCGVRQAVVLGLLLAVTACGPVALRQVRTWDELKAQPVQTTIDG